MKNKSLLLIPTPNNGDSFCPIFYSGKIIRDLGINTDLGIDPNSNPHPAKGKNLIVFTGCGIINGV